MNSILDIKGVKKLTRDNQSKTLGGGPDLCSSYETFYREVYCCGMVCSNQDGFWE